MSKPAISFNDVSKHYRIGRRLPSLRMLLGDHSAVPSENHHWAVKELSFAVEGGEALGIIGPNGAGKTTTLKLLSSVTLPSTGKITVNGRYSALIELGAGFHPDLTGRENVYLNGTILGMKTAEIKQRFDQIVDFSGIEQFIDTPVKRYSSGMYARLGFAIAAHVDPDVLLVDEVLAVGDYAFRRKCYERMDWLRQQGTSLIFVSHNFEDIQRVCDRGIVLYQGRKAFSGTADQAVAEYGNVLRNNASPTNKPTGPEANSLAQRQMTHGIKIKHVWLNDENGSVISTVRSGQSVQLCISFECFEDAADPVVACAIHGRNGEVVYDTTTRVLGITSPSYAAGDKATVIYHLDMHLLKGVYKLTADLAYADLTCYYDFFPNALTFTVTDSSLAKGTADLNARPSFCEGDLSTNMRLNRENQGK